MSLDRARVEQVVATIFSAVPPADIRLVGTASSLLVGVDLPATDIDVLFLDRAGVDRWFEELRRAHDVETAPTWFAESRQYFARISVDGAPVELSTVEFDTDKDTVECFGPGPWRHFQDVRVGEVTVPAVATELRLLTELARSRPDRLSPIMAFLRSNGCDLDLVRRGLVDLGRTNDDVDQLVAELTIPRTD